MKKKLKKALATMIDAAVPLVGCIMLAEINFRAAVAVAVSAGVVCFLRSVLNILQDEEVRE